MNKMKYYTHRFLYYMMITIGILLMIALIIDIISMTVTLAEVGIVLVACLIIYAMRLHWKDVLRAEKNALDHPQQPDVLVQTDVIPPHSTDTPTIVMPSQSSATTHRMGWQ